MPQEFRIGPPGPNSQIDLHFALTASRFSKTDSQSHWRYTYHRKGQDPVPHRHGHREEIFMRRTLCIIFISLGLAIIGLAAGPQYKLLTSIKIGGEVRWDDLFIDSANHRAYFSHNSQVEVVDTATDRLVGTIPDTPGVHGIAIANDLGRGFITYGTASGGARGTSGGRGAGAPAAPGVVLIFDPVSLKRIGTATAGQNPDALSYDPVTQRVITFNDRSRDATVIDAQTGEVIKASVPLGGKPAFSQADGKGHVYANIENSQDKQEIVEITMKDAEVTKRYPIDPCDDASGLAIDLSKMRLYTACGNKMVVVSDPIAGKVIGSSPSGAGADSIAFDDGYVLTPNGQDGTISMVGETSPGKFEQVATFPMAMRARIIGADQNLHKLYVPAADYGAGPTSGRGRAPALPGTFRIDVYGR
jgi:DNA-binding beta-propeller fold protein YncE